jgi:hypothetical protein
MKRNNTFIIPPLERQILFDKELITVNKFISEQAYERMSSRDDNNTLLSFLASREFTGSKLRSMSMSAEAIEQMRNHGFSVIVYGQELVVSRLAQPNTNGTHEHTSVSRANFGEEVPQSNSIK